MMSTTIFRMMVRISTDKLVYVCANIDLNAVLCSMTMANLHGHAPSMFPFVGILFIMFN